MNSRQKARAGRAITREEVERNLATLVSDVRMLLSTWFNRRVQALGLTTQQWLVLSELYRRDGLTQTELAESLDMAKSPLGKLVDKLESGGWVRRVPDQDDRRVNRVELTDRLEPLMAPLTAVTDELVGHATAGISDADFERLLDLLVQIKGNMNDALADPPEPLAFDD